MVDERTTADAYGAWSRAYADDPTEADIARPAPRGANRSREASAGVREFALTLGAFNALAWVTHIFSLPPGWSAMGIALVALIQVGGPVLLYVAARRYRASTYRLLVGSTVVAVLVAGASAYSDIVGLPVGKGAGPPSWVCIVVLLYALRVPALRGHPTALLIAASAYLVVGAVAGHAFGLYKTGTTLDVLRSAAQASIPTWLCCLVAHLLVRRSRRELARYERAVRALEKLGSYTLREKLGEGGMGEVWRADHAFLARPAAIKIVRPEVLGGLTATDSIARARARLALGRFEREAKATAQLTSPHTIQVFDFGRGPNHTFFYVMELLDGLDLHSLVAQHGAQPQARVRHILLQACDSLGEAHDRGMVHRDIKPANLFLCRRGQMVDHVKVLDFGLVRSDPGAKPKGVDTLPRLTRQGIISGSPSFMSPEQANGAEDLDRRADIYALGCVAYFLLAGAEPFKGNNPMVILMKQISDAPEPMRSVNPNLELHPVFEALIGGMLAKDRQTRPASADALRASLASLPLSCGWTQQEAQQWWTAHDPEWNTPSPSPTGGAPSVVGPAAQRLVRQF